jgi:glycerol kinase
MSKKDAYKQKIEAELELAQAKLFEFKARGKVYAADMHIKYLEQVEEIEHKFDATKAKLKKLDEAGEEKWEHFKDEVESAWNSLSAAVKDAAEKFKK